MMTEYCKHARGPGCHECDDAKKKLRRLKWRLAMSIFRFTLFPLACWKAWEMSGWDGIVLAVLIIGAAGIHHEGNREH